MRAVIGLITHRVGYMRVVIGLITHILTNFDN